MKTTARIARSLLLLLFSLPPVLARPSAPPGSSPLPKVAKVHRYLAYVPGGHERQKLDLYLPEDGKDLPLIINIHGGAFKMGSQADGVPLEYLAHGHAVASINYRLSQQVRFPAQLEDCKAEVPVTLYTVKGAGHGGFRGPKVSELTREFLATHLRPSDSKPR